jgi:hypothetical protein
MSLPGCEPASTGSPNISVHLSRQLQELKQQEERLKASIAVKNPYYWLTECTATFDEQDQQNPIKPFPDKMYLRMGMDYLENELSPIKVIKKSRTMMASWLVTGWAAHKVFNRPATKVVIQSRDEDTAVTCVKYSKALWVNSLPSLKSHWPLEKKIENQPDHELTMASGSSIIAIPGDCEKIRSNHPTIIILDEAAFMDTGEASYNISVATRCLHLVMLSSANPGFFEDLSESGKPTPWPYPLKMAA